MVMTDHDQPWFRGAVAYQIYPRSFYDANNDGVGDLRGIIEKLDYLAGSNNSLGVDVIWLSPFYTSPMADFGYDISNYLDVDPIFGKLSDFKELVREAHDRDIKVLIDLVANHTSDEHPWFIESKSSRHNSKRDWYIWKDAAKDGGLPNDWLSVFGGPAWQYDEQTGQYYLHSFARKQPDLNWDNPDVRHAFKVIMKFWLELGVDGFRADAVYWLSKDKHLRDDPPKNHAPTHLVRDVPEYNRLDHENSRNGPHLFDYLKEMTDVLKDYKDTFMVIEAYPEVGQENSEYSRFYSSIDTSRAAPFNMESIYVNWNAQSYSSFIDDFQAILRPDDLPIYTLGNHDKPRLASRIGKPSLPVAAVMLLSLPGMPFIYYGEEIGMSDVNIPGKQQNDPMSLAGQGRDSVRTPMQWTSEPNAGFSKAEPWLPVSDGYRSLSVLKQLNDDNSLLNLYRRLIKLRKNSLPLLYGDYRGIELEEGIMAFTRSYGGQLMIVILNFTDKPKKLLHDLLIGEVVLASNADHNGLYINKALTLEPHEGLIIQAS
jgi:alpha-glucosidase